MHEMDVKFAWTRSRRDKQSIRFPEDFELGRSWAELSRAQRSSAEPEPSSAEHFPIAHFWTQPKGAPARGGPHLGHFFSASGSKIGFS